MRSFHGSSSRAGYRAYLEGERPALEGLAAREAELSAHGLPFHFAGRCSVCERGTEFLVDDQFAFRLPDGVLAPNWRERQVCAHCGLNSRMRASLEFLRECSGATPDDLIYCTEQSTQLFREVAARFPLTLGSEYLRDGTEPGQIGPANLRCEDVTRLSFPDCSFEYILSFDVLEHVPDYRRALEEFLRCLRPEGTLLLSVPFNLAEEETLVRARLTGDGSIEHLLPPEYHGDPLSASGALCFYHFGWSLLSELQETGWRQAAVHLYASEARGHLGGPHFLISARRPPAFAGALFEDVVPDGGP
jgi:hypothetical protein